MGIDDRLLAILFGETLPEVESTLLTPGAKPAVGAIFTQHEWEQGLNISLVFRYLRSRFTLS